VFTIPAKQIEQNRDECSRRDHRFALSANHSSGTHDDPKAAFHLCVKRDREQVTSVDHYPLKTHRRQECATVFNTDATAQPIVARSVRAGLASSATTPGEPPSAPGSAPSDSGGAGRTTVDFYPVIRPLNGSRQRSHRHFGSALGGAT
jgi:hypothetical protein